MTGAATPVDGIAITDEITDEISTEVDIVTPDDGITVTVDAVVEALAPDEDDTGEPWTYDDPVFWDTVYAFGPPEMRHAIDMVIRRGEHVRTITVFDAVIPDGRGKHR